MLEMPPHIALSAPLFLSIQTVTSRTATSLYAVGRARELRGLARFYALRLGFAAALLGVVAVLFSGPVAQVLNLRSSLPVALLGVIFVLSTETHLQRGVVQGLQRFGAFGLGSALEGVAKIVAVIVLVRYVWPTETGAIVRQTGTTSPSRRRMSVSARSMPSPCRARSTQACPSDRRWSANSVAIGRPTASASS